MLRIAQHRSGAALGRRWPAVRIRVRRARTCSVEITDESGKIDLNVADRYDADVAVHFGGRRPEARRRRLPMRSRTGAIPTTCRGRRAPKPNEYKQAGLRYGAAQRAVPDRVRSAAGARHELRAVSQDRAGDHDLFRQRHCPIRRLRRSRRCARLPNMTDDLAQQIIEAAPAMLPGQPGAQPSDPAGRHADRGQWRRPHV